MLIEDLACDRVIVPVISVLNILLGQFILHGHLVPINRGSESVTQIDIV